MFYNKIVQIISSGCDYDWDDHHEGPPVVTTYDTAESLVDVIVGELSTCSIIKKLLANDAFVKQLEAAGWANLEQAEKVAEKATLGTSFYIWDTKESYARPRKIDFDKLRVYEADQLAKDSTELLCNITKGSLRKLNRKVYDSYLKAKKKAEERKVAAKKGAETRAANRKQKKIDAAKKLLKEAGEST